MTVKDPQSIFTMMMEMYSRQRIDILNIIMKAILMMIMPIISSKNKMYQSAMLKQEITFLSFQIK